MRLFITSIVVLLALTGAARALPPPNFSRIIFLDDFNSPDVDFADSRAAGWSWYVHPFFGDHRDPKASISFGPNGLTLANGSISSSALAGPGHALVGRSFSGPLYIEAVIMLGREPDHAKGWPAFWAMAAEHVAGGQDAKDPGGRGDRFIEDDFFERDTKFAGPGTYGATLHDWSGHYKVECPESGYCDTANNGHGAPSTFVMRADPKINWSKPHQIGQLIIPATSRSPGTVQNYLDGKPIGKPTHWRNRSDVFGVIDAQKLVLFLQSGDQPMIVRSLRIWKP